MVRGAGGAGPAYGEGPAGAVVTERIGGQLVSTARLRVVQDRLGAVLADALGAVGRPGVRAWWVRLEPPLTVGADHLVPDLGGWFTRLPPDQEPAPPDWVVELVHPAAAHHVRVRKLPAWHRAVVPCVWVVDVAARVVEVHRWGPDGFVVAYRPIGEGTTALEPFPGVPLRLGSLVEPARAPPPPSARAWAG